MKAFLINPYALGKRGPFYTAFSPIISEVDVVDGDNFGSIKGHLNSVSPEGAKVQWVDAVGITHKGKEYIVWVDEEGLFKPMADAVFLLTNRSGQALRGAGLLIGVDDDGNDIGAEDLTMEDVQSFVMVIKDGLFFRPEDM